MLDTLTILVGLGTIISLWLASALYSRYTPGKLPLPPGPRRWALIGNLLDVPKSHPWLTYDRWAKTYGDIMSLNVLGQTIIILNSTESAYDLFDKDSVTYSDRPHSVVINELMEFPRVMGTSNYGEGWRRQRKAFHQVFSPSMVEKYRVVMTRESRTMLKRLHMSPEKFKDHIRLNIGAVMMEVTYGIRVSGWDDKYLSTAELVAKHFMDASVPGNFLVEQIPMLKHVPAWFPLAGFQKKMVRWREDVRDAFRDPYDYVKREMAGSNTINSALSTLLHRLQDSKNSEEDDTVAQYAMASVYIAGVDTTLSAIQSFIMAMAMHPEEQKKAQAELDHIVGHNRLPDFSDHTNLPYVNAIMKETLRWQPPVPLGLPHSSSSEGVYKGYRIPAKATIFANAWSICRDPVIYPQPELFQPERFIKDGQLDLKHKDPAAVFGLGRRVCPGRWFSEASFYSMVSHLLYAYTIAPALDEHGNEMQMKAEMSSEVISVPVNLKCRFIPRCEHDLILGSQDE